MNKQLLWAALFASCIGTIQGSQTPDFEKALEAIRAVGPGGKGNILASENWKTLTTGKAETLLPLLEGMDNANDYALNWLRPAVETVASKQLSAGAKLPLAELGKFLLDTRHHPRARRLAFELLFRVEPSTTEKLLSGMINDPSLEIRYEAVQKVIDQASQTLASGNKPGATLLFQQALANARDVKQIDAIANKLEELGQPTDLSKLFGFLTAWKIVGPFDNTGRKGFETAYPPEEKIDLSADYEGKAGKVRWQEYVTNQKYGKVDLNQPYGKLKEVTAYATTDYFSDRAQTVELRFGGKNSWKLWLNGKLLFGRDEYHFDSEIDQYLVPAQLQAGRNTILVKVCQNEQTEDWTVEWEFQLRVTDSLGTPIISAPTIVSEENVLKDKKANRL